MPKFFGGPPTQFDPVQAKTIALVEVNDPDAPVDLAVACAHDATAHFVEQEVLKTLAWRHWWLQWYWRSKTGATEQIKLMAEHATIDVYNFAELLTNQHLDILERVITDLVHLNKAAVFMQARYVLCDDTGYLNVRSGLPLNGESAYGDGAVIRVVAKRLTCISPFPSSQLCCR